MCGPLNWTCPGLTVSSSHDAGVGAMKTAAVKASRWVGPGGRSHLAILKLLRSRGSLLGMHQSSAFWLTL